MKKNILIIALLIAALTGAFSLKANSQYSNKLSNVITIKTDTVYDQPNQTLIADETTLTYSKTEAKIHCSNETVFNKIFRTHGMIFKRFTCTWKADRHGRYKDYVIYLNKDDAGLIVKWAKTNL